MPPLSWRHHTLIQALLSRGPLKENEFQSIFSDVTGKNLDSHQQLFNEYLRKINMGLSYVQFELRACRNQYDGDVYYGVINTVADEQSKLGTKYTVPQIAFYKGIIEAIAQDATAQGSISNIDALNVRLEDQVQNTIGSQSQGSSTQVPAAFRNFSMSQKDKTIEEFVRDQWLCTTLDGRIGLGIRSFLDLRSWFRNNEVPPCDVCNEAGIKADLCPNGSCSVRIHKYCLKTKFSQRTVDKVCPGCGTQWPYVVAKAEALREEDQEDPSQNEPPPQPSLRKRHRSSRIVEEDQEDPSQNEPTHQPLLRKRHKSSRIVEEDQEDHSQNEPPPQPLLRKRHRSSRNVEEDEPNDPSQGQPSSQPSSRRRLRSSRNTEEDESDGPSHSQPSCQPSNRRMLKSSRNIEEDESNGPSQSQPSSQWSGRKKLRTAAVEIDNGSGPSQESASVSETRRVTRNSARLIGSK